MSAISTPSKDVIPSSYPETWITPRQQLDQLLLPLVQKITEAASSILPTVIITLTAEYAAEDILIIWYEALRKLNLLHIKIPPLPQDILQKLREPSIIRSLTRDKTHMLTVIPQEFTSLRIFEQMMKTYGAILSEDRESYQINGGLYLLQDVENFDTVFGTTTWELMTKNVFRNTRGIHFNNQTPKLEEHGYAVPSLHGSITAIFFHKIATDVSLYPKKDCQGTSTFVQDKYNGRQIAVGHFLPSGLKVIAPRIPHREVGLAGVIKL
jgi:hypothetical protein